MSAAAVRSILSGPVDPDLEADLVDLLPAARRIRQLESQIRLPDAAYQIRAALLAERADLYARFSTRAEKRAIKGDRPGRGLLMMVEEADRLTRRGRRKRPTLAEVLDAMRVATEAAERDHSEAECDLIAARYREAECRARVSGCLGAIAYLEASYG